MVAPAQPQAARRPELNLEWLAAHRQVQLKLLLGSHRRPRRLATTTRSAASKSSRSTTVTLKSSPTLPLRPTILARWRASRAGPL